MKLKKIDFLILKELIKDSSQSSKIIADLIGVTDKTIRNRIALMKDDGVFKPTILINHNKFGYGIKMDIFVKSDREDVQYIFDMLEKNYHFNITYMGMHWGEDDISIQAIFKDTRDVFVFRQQIKEINSARITSMKMVPYVFKDTNDWLPSPRDFKMNEEDSKVELAKIETLTADYQDMMNNIKNIK